MSELSEKIDALNTKIDSTSAKLDKVNAEYTAKLVELADVKVKLAAALAAGQTVPADVLEALNKALASVDATQAKADALDAKVEDQLP